MDHSIWECWQRNRRQPIYGRSLVHLKYWWAYQCEWKPGLMYHKVLCWRGKHVIRGGEVINLLGKEVTVVRCCIYCRKEA